jgi:hypothetical protein
MTFRERYLDVNYDDDGGNLADLLAYFDPTAAPARDPMTLRNAVVNESDTTSHAYLILQQDPADPTDPGHITVVHGVKMFPTRVGAGAGVWQGQSFAFVHDVLNRNDPQTVEFPLDAFHRATGAGAVQVWLPQALQLMLNADPTLVVANPPGLLDAGAQWTVVRYVQPIPFRFVAGLLHQNWRPREFFTMVYTQIVNEGLTADTIPLVNWMCVACTSSAVNAVHSRVGHIPLRVPLADNALRVHRHQLVVTKVPGLSSAPTTVGATQIASSLGAVVAQLRGVRQDAMDRATAASAKTPKDHYGPTLDLWMQLAQVATESNLQPIHQALAENGKKQTRMTWEQHITRAALRERYFGIRVVVPPTVAEKLTRCDWLAYDVEDLSTGINAYQFGGSTRENLSSFEDVARAHDLALLTGSGDLQQIHQVINDKTVDLPRTFHQAITQLKGFRLLLLVAFGPGHVATLALERFLEELQAHMETLHNYRPRAPDHGLLGPALICQQFRLHFNVWVSRQMTSVAPVAFPDQVHAVWDQLLLSDPSWEKPIPYRYLRLRQSEGSPSSIMYPAAAPAPSPGPAPAPSPSPAPVDERQAVHSNMRPNSAFEPHKRNRGNRTLKNLVIDAGTAIPKNDRGQEMCLTFHLLGSCNSRCRRKKDHNDIEPGGSFHTPAEDKRLLDWCAQHILPT